jgi:protein transport protein SEC24
MVVSTYEKRRQGRRLPVYIARQNIDGIEIEFSNMLIEDANNDNLSYVDYLCL